MAKKKKVMKNQTRKKSENEKKINPFEVSIIKPKLDKGFNLMINLVNHVSI